MPGRSSRLGLATPTLTRYVRVDSSAVSDTNSILPGNSSKSPLPRSNSMLTSCPVLKYRISFSGIGNSTVTRSMSTIFMTDCPTLIFSPLSTSSRSNVPVIGEDRLLSSILIPAVSSAAFAVSTCVSADSRSPLGMIFSAKSFFFRS